MKKYIRHILNVALLFSESIAQDSPTTVRPGIKIVVYLSTLLFIILVLPIALPFSFARTFLDRFRPQSLSTFMRLEQELKSIWYSESSVKALHSLREVHQKLFENGHQGLLKGIIIAPYGKFTFNDYLQVLWLLYQYEISHKNWERAKNICDEMLSDICGEESHLLRSFQLNQEWIVRKAKMLTKLEGISHARRYLLPYINPEKPENPITSYFYELGQATPRTGNKIGESRKNSDAHIISGKPENHERQNTNIIPFPQRGER